jgi:hypothetical protein
MFSKFFIFFVFFFGLYNFQVVFALWGVAKLVKIDTGSLYFITMATNTFLSDSKFLYEIYSQSGIKKRGEKLSWFNAKVSGWIRILATFWEVLQSMIVYQHIYDHSNQIHRPLVLHFAMF